ncbi:RiPP maturation radical SAM C-methyltransferase [Streptomyces sp. RerS4]|uniref:RiPP maturation radical SAM C-methyltransferase n=1 Tax=Streptomyces sp. RerS4 TaxID=2942449 RepID=UPI00201C669C|nr:RiPP maturation radical SAM C-methyltransferase [Streptomyces sp. RerS4]UQX04556.1 RiPP maturation radical SAM C-methyltransferase [Streptomyces sp. RerS4]
MDAREEPAGDSAGLSDPVRLQLLHVLFTLAQSERARRAEEASAPPATDSPPGAAADASEAARLSAALKAHMACLDDAELEREHRRLAGAFLREVDRRIAGSGTLPGRRIDFANVPAAQEPPAGSNTAEPRVALVSLPWMSPTLPSIQLATLASALRQEGIESDVHELYVDYAARIGLNLYNLLGNLLGYLPEWIFSRHYYGPEQGDHLTGMLEQRPLGNDFPWPELADSVLAALEPVTEEFLDDLVRQTDWSRYDVVGFSLTISQLGASMAVARRLKRAFPSLRIIFGGSQCAGPMGSTILRICPYVDAVVHIEGELVLADLVRRLRDGRPLGGLSGVSHRTSHGEVVTEPAAELVLGGSRKLDLDYDAYFHRLVRLGLTEKMNPWLPFESSRGCWYGQKVQCTFCGLHDIMEFRAWDADVVLAQLERLEQRYGVGRFYSMDLIMPREYLRTLLPRIAERHDDWMFFYEIKANMRRSELETLAAAGVRWVQPGIESLDADLLALMRKGVKPFQNVLLLKWCQELGIHCGWNLLFGLPGESQASYTRMAELIPKLTHLQPPSGGGRFQLHRFSPYFEQPEAHGVRWDGAHRMFRYAFPIDKADLDQLVYLHDFTVDPALGPPVDPAEVEVAVRKWRRAHQAGASLALTELPGGESVVVDHRDVEKAPARHRLDPTETALYRHLDAGVAQKLLAESFRGEDRASFEALGGESGITALVARWVADGLVIRIDGKILALAVHAHRMASRRVPASSGAGAASETGLATQTAMVM